MRMRLVPANGVPVTLMELIKVIGDWASGKGINFEKEFSDYIGVAFCKSVWSGRSALYLALSSFKKLQPDKNEVLLPVITCESVFYAVKKANLTAVLYDVKPWTLEPDIQSIEKKITDNTLCIIASPLFGASFDMNLISNLALKKDIFFLEDIAQSLGAEWQNKKLGSFGDVSIFSFGKSKNITTIQGGMICTANLGINKTIDDFCKNLPKPSITENLQIIILFIINYFIIKPFFFNMLVALKIKFADLLFDENFMVKRMGNFQKAAGKVMLSKINELNHSRKFNTERLSEIFSLCGSVVTIQLSDDSVHLRFPIILKSVEKKKKIIEDLIATGIWSGSSVYKPLNYLLDLPIEEFPGAKLIEDKIILIPTHPHLKEKDFHKIKSVLIKQDRN